jgi:hypothetical protein
MVPGEMKEEDLLVCCPTVPGFGLGDKFWGAASEFHRPNTRNQWSLLASLEFGPAYRASGKLYQRGLLG